MSIVPGSVPRTIAQKLSEHPSVLDFGARGDGVTDDTAAINLGTAAIAALGGGRLLFPQGTYRISTVILPSNVALEGAPSPPSYGNLQGALTILKAKAGIAAGAILVNAQHSRNTSISDISIIGDSPTQLVTQNDATTTGISYGEPPNSPLAASYARHTLRNVSVSMNKIGIENNGADYFWSRGLAVSSNWYMGIKAYNFGFNDSTMLQCYINSNGIVLPAGVDPNTDIYTGVGLYLGTGCQNQRWIGGKIEWNGTGVLIDNTNQFSTTQDANCAITISGIQFDANSKWHIRLRNNWLTGFILTTGITISNNHFSNCAWSITSGNSTHIFIDGAGSANANFQDILIATNHFQASAQGSPYAGSPGTKYPTDGVISASGGFLILTLTGNAIHKGAVNNQILVPLAGLSTSSEFWDLGNSGDYTWNLPPFYYARTGNMNVIPCGPTFLATPGKPTTVKVQASYTQGTADLSQWMNNGGTVLARVDSSGFPWWKSLKVLSDVSAVVTVGRYDAGSGTAVVDFNDPTGGAAIPTNASLRVGSTERLKLDGTGAKINGALKINSPGNATTDAVTIDGAQTITNKDLSSGTNTFPAAPTNTLLKAANLSDVANATTARTNLIAAARQSIAAFSGGAASGTYSQTQMATVIAMLNALATAFGV